MKKLCVIIIGVALLITTGAYGLPWWNTNYSYREKLTVKNNSSTDSIFIKYTVKCSLNTATLVTNGKLRADGNDLRICYWNGSNWIELHRDTAYFNTDTTEIWFPLKDTILPDDSSEAYYMYYDYSSASAASANRDSIYQFWDDFEDGNDDGWTEHNGNWSVVSNEYYQSDNLSTYMRASNGEASWRNYVLETKIKMASGGATGGFAGVLFRFQDVNNHYAVILDDRGDDSFWIRQWINGSYATNPQEFDDITFDRDTWYNLKVCVFDEGTDDSVKVYIDDDFKHGYAYSQHDSGKIALMMHGTQAYYDDIKVRLYIPTEPSVSEGTEDTLDFSLVVIEDTLNIGSVNPGASAGPDTFNVTNTGNARLDTIRYVLADLVSGSDTIPKDSISITPDPIDTVAYEDTAEAIVTVSVPDDQPVGTYTGIIRVYEDSSGNSSYDVGEPQDTFVLKLTVNAAYQPDEWIKNAGGSYTGDNVYEDPPSTQLKAQTVPNSDTASFWIKIENDANAEDSIKVTGTDGDANWMVEYWLDGTSNITGNVTGTGFIDTLASGDSIKIKVIVSPGAAVAGGECHYDTVKTVSLSDGSKKDAVEARTTCASSYQPDELIRGASGSYKGDNIYEDTPTAQQTIEDSVDNNEAAVYWLKIENDGNDEDSITVTGTGGSGSWTVSYLLDGTTDITSDVTGSGYIDTLTSGDSIKVKIEVTPDGTVGGGTTYDVTVTTTSRSDTDQKDAIKTQTSVKTSYRPDELMKKAGGSYIGNNVYEDSPSTQVLNDTAVAWLDTVAYWLKIENDGNRTDSFKVTGTGDGNGWSVEYWLEGTTDITSSVTGTGFIDTLDLGDSSKIEVKVIPDSSVNRLSTYDVIMTTVSNSDATKKDAAKFTTQLNFRYQPDAYVKWSLDTSYIGDEIYESSPSSQVKTHSTVVERKTGYWILIINKGYEADNIVFKGDTGCTNWEAKYYIDGFDITDDMTSPGGYTDNLNPGDSLLIKLTVTPNSSVSEGDSCAVCLKATSQSDNTKVDKVKTLTIVEWWNSGWGIRKQLVITNNCSGTLPEGYSVKFNLNHYQLVQEGKSLSSGDDIRIVWWNPSAKASNVELHRVNETVWNNAATQAEIWFKTKESISSAEADSNYYIYYDNLNAGSPPASRDSVYQFWDDFENETAGNSPSKWTVGSGTWTVREYTGNKVLREENSASSYHRIWETNNPSWTNIAVTFKMYLTTTPSGIDWGGCLFRRQVITQDQHYALVGDRRAGSESYRIGLRYWDSGYTYLEQDGTNFNIDQWYDYEIKVHGDIIKLYRDEVEYVNHDISGDANSWSTGNGVGLLTHSGYTRFDDVKVRLYVTDEPTITPLEEKALAVELLSFNAIPEDWAIMLTWVTDVEIDNSHWIIEKSQNGQDYTRIKKVDSEGPTGYVYTYIDTMVQSKATYWYKLGDIDREGNIKWHGPVKVTPYGKTYKFVLSQAYPNPLNKSAVLSYSVPGQSKGKKTLVNLSVYDLAGRLSAELVNGKKSPGVYKILWKTESLSQGVYFYRLKIGDRFETKKAVLLK